MIKYRPDIDGLRALAVLSVVLYHFNSELLPAGFIGVDIFFVISGYLITGILLNSDKNNLSTLLKFYASRFNRIVPAYFVMLLVVSVISSFIFIKNDYTYFSESLKFAFFFSSNFYFQNAGDYFSPQFYEYPLLHTWSLSIEMMFYFAWPIIVIFFRTKNRVLLYLSSLFIIMSLTLSVIGKLDAVNNYYDLLPRFTEILIGSFAIISESSLKEKINKKLLSTIGFVFILFSYYLITSQGYPGVLYLLPCVGTALMLTGNNSNSPGIIKKILTHKIAVTVGRWSYSIYLWHWPVLAFTRYITGKYELSFSSSLVFFALTFVLSLASYYFIESKRKLINSKSNYSIPGFIIAYTILFGIINTLTIRVNNFISTKSTYSGEYAKYDDYANICHGKINGTCLKGVDGSKNKVLVIGDSHAAELNEFFNIYGKHTNTEFKILTASSCVPITGFDYHSLQLWAQESCKMMIKEVNSNINNYNTIIIAGMWSYQLKSSGFDMILKNYLSSYKDKKFYLVSQAPLLSNNIQRTLRLEYLHIPFKANVDSAYHLANQRILKMATGSSHVKFVDTHDFFNQLSEFPFINKKPIYFDNSHLNMYGVQQMAIYFISKGKSIY